MVDLDFATKGRGATGCVPAAAGVVVVKVAVGAAAVGRATDEVATVAGKDVDTACL